MGAAAQTIHPVMVGTAGHIDHGKSSLVRALTGVDPDRLKEEKERGLTIDLGFAPLVLRDGRVVGMVDVPGHERFVRNMVAGSTALDLALLVVAADDGVMPQTREHLDILQLLGVRRGLVALTKIDLVEGEVADLAEAEVRELLAGTTLAGSPLVRVSATTGQGMASLRRELERLALATPPRAPSGAFRMPVQRVFTLKGIGTVVTGIPVSGAVAPGDSVEFLPGGHVAKVRAVQAFGGPVERAVAGHSAALSVPDAKAAGLARGVVAAAPGIFQVGDAVDVDLRLLERAPTLRHRRPVRFHTGTSESQGVLLLLDRDELRGGESQVARLLLADAVSCAPGDRFLLRLQNPVATVGGGVVLRLSSAPRRYHRRHVGVELERIQAAGSSPESRLLQELALAGPGGAEPAALAAALAIDQQSVRSLLATEAIHYHQRGGRAFLAEVVARGIAEVEAAVARMLRDRPLAASVQRSAFRATRALPAPLLEAVLDLLQERGQVRSGAHGRVTFRSRLRPLAERDRARLDRVVAACEARGYRPPTREELAAEVGEPPAGVDDLVARAVDEGRLEPIGDFVFGGAALRRALHAIRANCRRNREVLDIPALRDELATSRKYLIPLLEYVDGTGLTRLRGGVRVLLPSSAVCRELAAEAGGADAPG